MEGPGLVRVRVGTGGQGLGQSWPLQPQVQAQSINLSSTKFGPGAILVPQIRPGSSLRALLVHSWRAWSGLACMSTWRAAESPTHASTPECSQEYRDGQSGGWVGWREALPTFHGLKLGPAAALEASPNSWHVAARPPARRRTARGSRPSRWCPTSLPPHPAPVIVR